MIEIPTWTEWAIASLERTQSPYSQRLTNKLEMQFMPVEDDDEITRLSNTWPIVGNGPSRHRIPLDGATKPADNDGPVRYHPDLIARFGTSWWNWRESVTEAAGFDFDFGHGARGLDEVQIAEVDRLAISHPSVMNCTSRGGKGRHWTVWLEEPVKALTRSEHQAVCDAILVQLSNDLGVDIAKYLCSYGKIMYLFDRRVSPDGFKLLSAPTRGLSLATDWPSITKSMISRTRFSGASPGAKETLRTEAETSRFELDEVHQSIIETMLNKGFPAEVDNHAGKTLIRLHTKGLEADYITNKRAGVYATDSPGSDPDSPNAFAFLKANGGLAIRRFNTDREAGCWHRGPGGLLCIDYNTPASFDAACRHCGGKKDRRDDYLFTNGKASDALRMVGASLVVPEFLLDRPVTLKRDGEAIHVSVPGNPSEKGKEVTGWRYHYGKWEHDLDGCLPAETIPKHEERIRHTVEGTEGRGWHILDDTGSWITQPLTATKTYLKGAGHDDYEVSEIIAHHMNHNWVVKSIPFAGEYPDTGRVWNRDGARLACEPEKGDWSHWKMILDHCGQELDGSVARDEWCNQHNIRSGGDWLKMWAAILVRYPHWRLPYLFLFSEEQNSGKSTFHRALTRLFASTKGWCELRKELTRDDFNDQMAGAALCILEEIDLSQNHAIYNLVKGYVDNPHLKMRGMYSKAETVVNYTHFVHTANHRSYCPIYPRDTRIVLMHVPRYAGPDLPWLTKLEAIIDRECPGFLHELLTMQMPSNFCGRLSLPVLETPSKREAMLEREAEMTGWYAHLHDLAVQGKIQGITAQQLHSLLTQSCKDSSLPKGPAGLSSKLKAMQQRLERDGLTLSTTDSAKGKPARYSIAEMALGV